MSSGHGGGWIVTYSDMVTLLMACFIIIITFSSKEKENYARKRDSLLPTRGDSLGIAGPAAEGLDHDAVVWRVRPPLAHLGVGGSEIPPLYSDPSLAHSSEILHQLDKKFDGDLRDSFAIRVPLALLFDAQGNLLPSAVQLLHAVARKIRALPYDLQVQVADARNTGRALRVAQDIVQQEHLHPGRVAVGVRGSSEAWDPYLWLVYARRR